MVNLLRIESWVRIQRLTVIKFNGGSVIEHPCHYRTIQFRVSPNHDLVHLRPCLCQDYSFSLASQIGELVRGERD